MTGWPRGRGARLAAGVLGVLLVLVGVVAGRVLDRGPLVGALLWLLAAVVLHDVLLAPAVAVVGRGLLRLVGGSRQAHRVAVAAAAVAGTTALVAVPGLVARAQGPRNPSVHPTDYAQVLAVVWAVAAAVVLVAAAAGRVSRRRAPSARGRRSSSAPRTARSPSARGGAAGEGPGPSTS
ncbi:hypothetical protein [Streptomyces sp. NP160]|uniref:hypothetical protein n=1 Tax=Streptomyces sp. NP160 TaxID=2586637 RepID=UPI0015D633F7|nr:hypothetical protein [Streptomyces sp. NP160]